MFSSTYIKQQLIYNSKRVADLSDFDCINLIVGCCQIITQAGGSFKRWVGRKDRKRLLQVKRLTKQKQACIQDLITYAISCVDACWHDEFTLGALPVQREITPEEIRQRKEAGKASAAKRAATIAEQERAHLEALEKRISAQDG